MKSILGIIVLWTLCVLAYAGDVNSTDPIRLMILTHSHDDVGWTKTPQQYYDNYVGLVYETMIPVLTADPKHK